MDLSKKIRDFIGKKTSFLNEYNWVKILRGFPVINIDIKDANDIIATQLLKDEPCLIARIGGNELDITVISMRRENDKAKKYPEVLSYNMREVAGFFPISDENFDKFGQLHLSIFSEIDILASWRKNEKNVKNIFKYKHQIDIRHLEPFRAKQPWTYALKGRKVLIINPFEKTIRSQYTQKNTIFSPPILPDFDLITYKPVVSHGGNSSNMNYNTWFDALDSMKIDIGKLDFDVALIGAGAYGLPLGNFIKQMGKKAVVLGGVTQFIFGIKGGRWDSNPIYNKHYNEYWVRPSKDERPPNPNLVEGNAYF